MRKWLVVLALMSASLAAPATGALQPVCKALTQDGVPLQITAYACNYQRRSDYSPEGIRHALEYKNVSAKTIEALEIGLVSFNVWNTYMDRTGGISIETIPMNVAKKGTWVASAYRDFAFLTGVAYVAKVRFNDGTIWSADLDAVAAAMREIEGAFNVQTLKTPEKPDTQ